MNINLDIISEPPIESEIVSRWDSEKGNLVSICMLSYNHEPYLRDALNSILNQKTNFGFELLVHDDASQDGSAELIREYARRYPSIVKPILQSVNQHSQRIYPSVHFNYPRAQLPFIAMCEGDDHWTDENKLQIQVDSLLSNPAINLSFHSAFFVDYQTDAPPRIYGDYGIKDQIVPFESVLHRDRGWIPLASCVIRQQAKQELLKFLSSGSYLTVGDIYFQFFGSLPSGAFYHNRPMSLYRFKTPQSWTLKTLNDAEVKARHEIAMIRSYYELNRLTEKQYQEDFTALVLQRLFWLFNQDSSASPTPTLRCLSTIHQHCEALIDSTLAEHGRTKQDIVIYGCGSACKKIIRQLPPETVKAVVDRDNLRCGEFIENIPIIGLAELEQYRTARILISTIAHGRATVQRIKAMGFSEQQISQIFQPSLAYLETQSHAIESATMDGYSNT